MLTDFAELDQQAAT
jgi:hypothetical protein